MHVRRIVEGETKVSKLPKMVRTQLKEMEEEAATHQESTAAAAVAQPRSAKENEQAENLRSMFVAMAEDWRIVVVKLADRLYAHGARTRFASRSHPHPIHTRQARRALEAEEGRRRAATVRWPCVAVPSRVVSVPELSCRALSISRARSLPFSPSLARAHNRHNMRTLQYMPVHKRIAIARETLEIFAPLAHRLGMWQFRSELADLSFKYLFPAEHARLEAYIDSKMRSYEETLRAATVELSERLSSDARLAHVRVRVTGRTKSIHSTWKKTVRDGLPVEQINDVRAAATAPPPHPPTHSPTDLLPPALDSCRLRCGRPRPPT